MVMVVVHVQVQLLHGEILVARCPEADGVPDGLSRDSLLEVCCRLQCKSVHLTVSTEQRAARWCSG